MNEHVKYESFISSHSKVTANAKFFADKDCSQVRNATD